MVISFDIATELIEDSYILLMTNTTNNVDCSPNSNSFCNKFWF